MAKKQVVAGTASYVDNLFILDSASTVGAGKTGLVYNTASLTCYYKRSNGTASVAVTLVTITTLGTFASGGFKAIDGTNMPGLYEFHPPDAAFNSGAKFVTFFFQGAAGMVPVALEYEITATDNQDATKGGISNIDAAITTRSTLTAANVWDALLSGITTASSIGKLIKDNLDAAISSRGTSTLTAALVWDYLTSAISTSGSIGKLLKDNIDAAITSRLASASYTAPPSVANIWDYLTSSISTSGSIGKLLKDDIDTTISSRSSHTANDVWEADLTFGGGTIGELVNTTCGIIVDWFFDGGPGISAVGVASIWDALTSSFSTSGSIGKLLKDDIDATISSRLATSGYTAPSAAAIWDYLTSSISTSGSIGKLIKDNLDVVLSSKLDVATSTRSTLTAGQAGSGVWEESQSHTTAGTMGEFINYLVTTINFFDLDGVNLKDTGLDNIANDEPPVPPTNFKEALALLTRRFLNKTRNDKVGFVLEIYGDDGSSVIGTAAYTTDNAEDLIAAYS